MTTKTLIFGASGLVGSEIARLLTSRGQSVRTTSSKGSRPAVNGIEQVKLNALTGEGLQEAFQGVDQAFIMAPGGHADQYSLLSPLIQQAKRSGLKKVVLMTALGANAVDTTPFRRAEKELEVSGLNYNIIRPNWFMQNFQTFWVHGIKTERKILLPAGQAKVSFIDSRDIAEAAAQLLSSHRLDNRAFDLTGNESLDHNDVARLITKSIGTPVTYQEIEPAQLKAGLLGAGLKEDYADFLLLILGFLREGYNAHITPDLETILGHKARTFAAYVQDNRSAWL